MEEAITGPAYIQGFSPIPPQSPRPARLFALLLNIQDSTFDLARRDSIIHLENI